jgi:hypothetical protein
MKLLFLTLLAFCGPAIADGARDAAWRQDLDYLTTQLPQLHPNLFFRTPRAVFDQAAADLRDAIPSLPDTDVMVGMATLVALARDGHTNLFLPQRPGTFRTLPLRVKWFADGLYVTAASPAYGRALGARVTGIGSRTAEDAYQAVAAAISHENDIWARETSPDYLVNADILRALGVAPSSDTVTFALEDRDGAFSLDVASLDLGAAAQLTTAPDGTTGFTPLYQQHRDRNYWFTYIESSRTLYFAYNACQQMADLPFTRFNDQFWATFDSRPVERLIIDLRNNGGGDSSIITPFLISGFARMQQFAGVRPYVIIGGRTFSSAVLNAIDMKQGPVTQVGQPTGGSPNSYGEVRTLTLPNSGLRVNYSTRYFSFPNLPPGSLLPDVTVPVYSSDYFARQDPFVAAVLADAPPSSDPVTAAITITAAPLDGDGRTFQVTMTGPETDDTAAIPRIYVGNDLAAVSYGGPGVFLATVPDGAALTGEVPLFAVLGNAFSNVVAAKIGN